MLFKCAIKAFFCPKEPLQPRLNSPYALITPYNVLIFNNTDYLKTLLGILRGPPATALVSPLPTQIRPPNGHIFRGRAATGPPDNCKCCLQVAARPHGCALGGACRRRRRPEHDDAGRRPVALRRRDRDCCPSRPDGTLYLPLTTRQNPSPWRAGPPTRRCLTTGAARTGASDSPVSKDPRDRARTRPELIRIRNGVYIPCIFKGLALAPVSAPDSPPTAGIPPQVLAQQPPGTAPVVVTAGERTRVRKRCRAGLTEN